MEFRCWIGIWTFILLVLIVLFNLSFLVKYITRFTEDCFAFLVAFVFIIDSLKSVLNLRKLNIVAVSATQKHHLNHLFQNLTSYNSSNSFLSTSADLSKTTINPNPVNVHNHEKSIPLIQAEHNLTFFFSILLFVITFTICVELKGMRETPYFPTKVTKVNFFWLINKYSRLIFPYKVPRNS